ncbi:serine/threonine-protein kinase [Streptomyces lincolnensis]|uniref:serine/threonine-protein kinase n=1 Tax=Streptomyces lincolnensis TaxID=1915 RepID=UPI0037CFE6A1
MGTEGENVRVIAGRYRLEERLGRGGMGVVWRATDQLLGRCVAVKELPLDETLSAAEARRRRDRTLREARAVAQLRHPHVIVVHDVVEHDERPYIVMELIEGGSLADRIAAHGPLDADEAARIGIALSGALRAAHAAGMLHRDIKPANVLLEEAAEGDRPGHGRVVLTDFGIAQVSGATTLTETGSFVGSPEYTAPERMSGARTGPASDLWSLGALLCTALSGESPFRRDSLGGILHAVVSAEIRPPAQAGPILPVVRGLLERDPERRLDAARAEAMLRAFRDTGRTPDLPSEYVPSQYVPSGYTPTRADLPGRPPAGRSTRGVLVSALLVAAMAGAGVSAAALLMNRDGGIPAPAPSVSLPSAPSGYRLADDPAGFALAVPEDFTREPQGERVFYTSRGRTFRIGVRVTGAGPGGPLGAMRRSAAEGATSNPGYRDGRITATRHRGHPAALWEFTWDGFTAAEGPRHTYDLCWEADGRLYDVWVSAPVGKVREAREYFDVAVGTFVDTNT